MSKPNTRAIIDANIRQNGRHLITGQVLNAVLNSMVTDYAEQAALDGLKEKVDALALGAFYGYFPDSDSLPADVTTPGYAYVGTDNPYEIWNFNGESWSDSGTSIDMNDADEEDITRNADGKLQFKDRSHGDGMGYVILRKDMSLADQMTQTNTIYEIRYDFNVESEGDDPFSIPNDCILYFNGGTFNGGKLNLNNASIIAAYVQIFNACVLSGRVKNIDFPVAWVGLFADDSSVDCAGVFEDYLSNLRTSFLFGRGVYYFDELYIQNTSDKQPITFKGQTDQLVVETTFMPYREGQRYILKFGGGRDTFGVGTERAYSISVLDINFNGRGSAYKLVNNIDSTERFECGYLIFDTIEVGNLAVRGSNIWRAPLVSFGYSYEIHARYINLYGNHTHSKCPAIQFFSNSTSRPTSAFTIEEIKTEVLCGPIIGQCENAVCYELLINNINTEGSQMWELAYLTDVDTYLTTLASDEERNDAVKTYNNVPFFRIFRGDVIVDNFVSGSTAYRWKNSLDGDSYCANVVAEFIGSAGYLTLASHVYNNIPVYVLKGTPSRATNLNSFSSYRYIRKIFVNGNSVRVNAEYKKDIVLHPGEYLDGFELGRALSAFYENYGDINEYGDGVSIYRGVIISNFQVVSDVELSVFIKGHQFAGLTTFTVTYARPSGNVEQKTRVLVQVNKDLVARIPIQYFADVTSISITCSESSFTIRKIVVSDIPSMSGTFANRPTTIAISGVYYYCGYIPIGQPYFCTDRSIDGGANGIMIYHKGNNVWVTANGVVVE